MTTEAIRSRKKNAKKRHIRVDKNGIPLDNRRNGPRAELYDEAESTPVDFGPGAVEDVLTGAKAKMQDMASSLGFGKLSAKPLTVKEVDDLQPLLISAIVAASEGADWFISHSNRAHATAIIWSMDEEDAEILAAVALVFGRKSGTGAMAIRGVAQAGRFYDVGKLTLPRFYQTFTFYMRNGGLGW